MTAIAKLALDLLPGGLLLLAATWHLFRCRHPHELRDRDADGLPILRCSRCLRTRANILASPAPAFHRTQGPKIASADLTGIERHAADVDASIAELERMVRDDG